MNKNLLIQEIKINQFVITVPQILRSFLINSEPYCKWKEPLINGNTKARGASGFVVFNKSSLAVQIH